MFVSTKIDVAFKKNLDATTSGKSRKRVYNILSKEMKDRQELKQMIQDNTRRPGWTSMLLLQVYHWQENSLDDHVILCITYYTRLHLNFCLHLLHPKRERKEFPCQTSSERTETAWDTSYVPDLLTERWGHEAHNNHYEEDKKERMCMTSRLMTWKINLLKRKGVTDDDGFEGGRREWEKMREHERETGCNEWISGGVEWINEGKRIKGTGNGISVGDPQKRRQWWLKLGLIFHCLQLFTHSSLQDQRKNTSSVSASKASWEKQEQGRRRPWLKTEMEATTFLSHQKKKQSKDEEVTEWATSESLQANHSKRISGVKAVTVLVYFSTKGWQRRRHERRCGRLQE